MQALAKKEFKKNPTNQSQALYNKADFVDFRAYYKSIYFEILRDRRKISEELELNEIRKKYKTSFDNIISKGDIGLFKEILSNEKYKKQIESAGKTTALEFSKIIYELNYLDLTKTEDDYISVLKRLLNKRNELAYKLNIDERMEFVPSEKMTNIRNNNFLEIEIDNNGNPKTTSVILKYLSPKKEISQNSIFSGEGIGYDSIKKRELKAYLEYIKNLEYDLSYIKGNSKIEDYQLSTQEVFFIGKLLDFITETSKVSSFNSEAYINNAIDMYNTKFKNIEEIELFRNLKMMARTNPKSGAAELLSIFKELKNKLSNMKYLFNLEKSLI